MADDNFQTKEHIRKQSCNTKSKQLKGQMEMSKDFGIEISSDDIYFDKSYGSPSINTNTSASPNINKPIVINFFWRSRCWQKYWCRLCIFHLKNERG